jgi:hypothetical protein
MTTINIKPDQSKSNDAKNMIIILTVIDERERERDGKRI